MGPMRSVKLCQPQISFGGNDEYSALINKARNSLEIIKESKEKKETIIGTTESLLQDPTVENKEEVVTTFIDTTVSCEEAIEKNEVKYQKILTRLVNYKHD